MTELFEFKDGEQRILSSDQLLVLKLTLGTFPHSYYENSFKDGWCSHDGKLTRHGSKFLGYMEEIPRQIGFRVESQSFVSVHKFAQNWDWDGIAGDEGNFKPWILFFQGCDDISYYLKFATEQTLMWYFESMRYFYATRDMIVYN